jgi:hypothetical protein
MCGVDFSDPLAEFSSTRTVELRSCMSVPGTKPRYHGRAEFLRNLLESGHDR